MSTKMSDSETHIPTADILRSLKSVIDDIDAAEPSGKKDLAAAAKSLADILRGDEQRKETTLIEELMKQVLASGGSPTAPDGDSPEAIPEHLQEEK